MKLLNVAVSVALLSSLTLPGLEAASDPIANVSGGAIRGRLISSGGASFKGVPFAQPPVGDLRWHDPVTVKPWAGVRDAGDFGASCVQPKMISSPQNASSFNEDCLFLNIWTPEWPAKSPKAVMVWIYGGANIDGTSSLNFYDGTALSRRDVIVVTFNFRLGVFGFFAHPELTAESPHHSSGNYGLLDQIAALQWVHDNIAKFGGDPKNVTLFGQSSGAIDTSILVASPLSKGLIQRAIQESGPPIRPLDAIADAEKQGIKFAATLNAPTGGRVAIKFLRSLSATDIEKVTASWGNDPVPLERPVIDGYLAPEYPALSYKGGYDLPIPMIIGNNARETSREYKADAMKRWIKDNYGSLSPQANEYYGWANNGTGKSDPFFGSSSTQVRADVRDRCPALAEMVWRTTQNHTTYEYMWDVPIPGEAATRHAAEIPFVFGNLLPSGGWGGPYTEEDKKISDVIEQYWTNFAKTGNPNGKGLPEWPKFNIGTRPYLEFTVHDGPLSRENLRRGICDLYIEALKETIPANTAGNWPQ